MKTHAVCVSVCIAKDKKTETSSKHFFVLLSDFNLKVSEIEENIQVIVFNSTIII